MTSKIIKSIITEIDREDNERKDMIKAGESMGYLEYDKGYRAALFTIKMFILNKTKEAGK